MLFTKAGSVLGDTQDYYIKITIEKSFATTTKKLSILLTLYCSIKLCSLLRAFPPFPLALQIKFGHEAVGEEPKEKYIKLM